VESVTLAVIGGISGIVVHMPDELILYLAFQTGGPNNTYPSDATPSGPALFLHSGHVGVDRDNLWDRTGLDDFACRARGLRCGGPSRFGEVDGARGRRSRW